MQCLWATVAEAQQKKALGGPRGPLISDVRGNAQEGKQSTRKIGSDFRFSISGHPTKLAEFGQPFVA